MAGATTTVATVHFFGVSRSLKSGVMTLDRPNGVQDSALMREFSAGSVEALGMLYDRLADSLYPVAIRICGNTERASMVVEQVFTEMWNDRKRYRSATAIPYTELLGRCRQVALNSRRAGRDGIGASGTPPAISPEAARGFAPEALRSAVDGVLGSVPREVRTVVELAYFDGLGVTEIAEQTHLARSLVLVALRKALDELRPLLGVPSEQHGGS